MVEDFGFTHEGRSYRCWDQSGGVSTVPLETAPRSSAMLTGSLRLMEISTASSRQAMTTDKRLATKRACGVGSLTPLRESKPAPKIGPLLRILLR